MNDLNTMLRKYAQNGLQTQLDAAVQAGDTDTARKVTEQIAQLAVQTAPKQAAYGDKDIIAAVEAKVPWFGVDPKKSSKAIEFGKMMDLKRFPTAEAFADAVIKAVDEEFKPATPTKVDDTKADETGDDDEDDDGDEDEKQPDPPRRARRSDGPGEGDGGVRASSRRSSGPWKTLSDAPREVQAEIKRQADKFAPKTKEGRETFQARALESHYRIHQQKVKK